MSFFGVHFILCLSLIQASLVIVIFIVYSSSLVAILHQVSNIGNSTCFIYLFEAADPQMNNVKRWYGHLMSQDVFHKSSSEVTGGKGVSTFKVTKRQKLDICIRVNFNNNIIFMVKILRTTWKCSRIYLLPLKQVRHSVAWWSMWHILRSKVQFQKMAFNHFDIFLGSTLYLPPYPRVLDTIRLLENLTKYGG